MSMRSENIENAAKLYYIFAGKLPQVKRIKVSPSTLIKEKTYFYVKEVPVAPAFSCSFAGYSIEYNPGAPYTAAESLGGAWMVKEKNGMAWDNLPEKIKNILADIRLPNQNPIVIEIEA